MPSVIDEFLPAWDVAHEERIKIHASAEAVYESMRRLDMSRSWGIRQLFRLRGMPRRALAMEGLEDMGFTLLAEHPPQEIVLGLIGRFWSPSGHLRRTSPQDFRSFSEPGYAKAAWGFRVQPLPTDGVVLSTETRVLCLDEGSRRRFRRYWAVIGPFSRWIRRRALRLVKEASELR